MTYFNPLPFRTDYFIKCLYLIPFFFFLFISCSKAINQLLLHSDDGAKALDAAYKDVLLGVIESAMQSRRMDESAVGGNDLAPIPSAFAFYRSLQRSSSQASINAEGSPGGSRNAMLGSKGGDLSLANALRDIHAEELSASQIELQELLGKGRFIKKKKN